MANAKLADAVASAVPAAQAELEGGDKDGDKSDKGTAATAPEATDDKSKTDSGTPPEVSSDVQTKEVPETLFGVDLSVLPDDETRQKFIDEFTETNKTINKLQREAAEAKKPEPVAPTPEPTPPAADDIDVSKLTDEQIAEAMGLDTQNLDDRDLRDVATTRALLEQQARLDKMEASYSEAARTSVWGQTFDALERDYGKLPEGMEREDVFAWAKAQGITDPAAAFWAAAGPVRATVSAALQQRLVELKTTDKKSATTPRPTTSASVEEKLQATNVKDAVKEAFAKAQKQLGIGDKE